MHYRRFTAAKAAESPEWKESPWTNPTLIAALADERRRQCPCGAVAERPDRLCRKCHARMTWRRKTTRTSRRAARRLAAHPGPRRYPHPRQRDGTAPGHRQGSGELMLTVLISLVFAVSGLVVILLAVVVAGIRQRAARRRADQPPAERRSAPWPADWSACTSAGRTRPPTTPTTSGTPCPVGRRPATRDE